MPQVVINTTAVFAASVAMMVVGFLWYSPALFGKVWMRLTGFTAEKMEASKKKGMAKTYAIQFILSLVTVYVLAHVIEYTNATTVTAGLQGGFWMWLGFVAAVSASSVLFESKPFKLYLINIGHELVGLMVAGAILASWK